MSTTNYKNSKLRLYEIIKSSSLQEEQKGKWYLFIDQAGEEGLMAVLLAVEGGEQDLNLLTQNLEDKLKALGSKDKIAWGRITQSELACLGSL